MAAPLPNWFRQAFAFGVKPIDLWQDFIGIGPGRFEWLAPCYVGLLALAIRRGAIGGVQVFGLHPQQVGWQNVPGIAPIVVVQRAADANGLHQFWTDGYQFRRLEEFVNN